MSNGDQPLSPDEEVKRLLEIVKKDQALPDDRKGLMASVGELADALVEELPAEEAVGGLRALLGVRRVLMGPPGGPPEAQASPQATQTPAQAPRAPEPPKPTSAAPSPAQRHPAAHQPPHKGTRR